MGDRFDSVAAVAHLKSELAAIQEPSSPQVSKNAALMVFLAIPYKMEAVRSPLGYGKECQVRLDRFAGHSS